MKSPYSIHFALIGAALAICGTGCSTFSWCCSETPAAAKCSTCTPCYVPCTYYSRLVDDYVTNFAAEKYASRDLHEWQKAAGSRFTPDFRLGYRQAYHDLANGSEPRVPPIPPCKYWNAYYRSSVGQPYVDEWFEGYQAGLEAGLQVGISDFNRVPARIADPFQPYHPKRIPRVDEFDHLADHGSQTQNNLSATPAEAAPIDTVGYLK